MEYNYVLYFTHKDTFCSLKIMNEIFCLVKEFSNYINKVFVHLYIHKWIVVGYLKGFGSLITQTIKDVINNLNMNSIPFS